MTKSLHDHLEESIKLEVNLAKLYTVFNDLFPEDEEFWFQLAMEERGHAALLQQEKKQPHPIDFFPENLLAKDLQSLIDANKRVLNYITVYSENMPSRKTAFETALSLENSAGEAHFQHFLDSPNNSLSATIFKQLNLEDRDHAERIEEYMLNNGLS
ncbi:hypothetical protein [Chlorobium phaeobacteroides]|uniref:Rubrerythrin diiron-binding domain-containing protein n=1 Tax=Chlorobium phaeobacteroides (strain DSM 266 / SMG 266 / 2430) TaxID=290317 RepID=A1BE26_CHLPD|nr:hypothetical protein [Chlorobium phaeobacteroides]ABL64653.1 conserved hypothetical protein [Chlorobium phaeobacteroides DSM 266]